MSIEGTKHSRITNIPLQQRSNVVLDNGVPLVLANDTEDTDGLLAIASVRQLDRGHISDCLLRARVDRLVS